MNTKNQYIAPKAEVIEMEVQTAIMNASGMKDVGLEDIPTTPGGKDFWGN